MTRKLVSMEEDEKIPYQNEVMGGGTGTDADSIADAQTGVRTTLLSLPLRYMHTPVEMLDMRDIVNTSQLMAEFAKKGAALL